MAMYKIRTGKAEGKRPLSVDGRIILKWILKKQGLRVWTVFIWPRIGTDGVLVKAVMNEDGCLLGCSALKIEAGRTSETFANFYQTTRRYNPEYRHLHTRRRENLKTYLR
jgi:hypothetical protein